MQSTFFTCSTGKSGHILTFLVESNSHIITFIFKNQVDGVFFRIDYVVEGVRSSSPMIYKIHNPSNEVDRFVFDGGWKQIADSADAQIIEIVMPLPGDEVYLNDVFLGIVETTRSFGKFPLVLYRDEDNNLQRKRLADITIRSRLA